MNTLRFDRETRRELVNAKRPAGRSARLRAALNAMAGALLAATALSGHAALKVGARAPDFSTEAALGGKAFRFALAEALARGPVVLYFYPKAFTSGCTIEAHEFAEATPRFDELGATVVGMSNDDIDTLKKFSLEACRSKFAVAADAGAKVAVRYDAAFAAMPTMASRISYVIDPSGRVLHVIDSPDPYAHVRGTLEAVERWRMANPVKR
jgi:thioredoxin-dependent peroxiredoxin